MNSKNILIALGMFTIASASILFLFRNKPTPELSVDDTESSKLGIQEVVNANNEFAFDLYSQLNKSENGNIFYSPYSISSALAMTYEGTGGQTAKEMKSVFHFPEINILRPNFAAIYNKVNQKDKPYELSTGNALWVQKDYKFLQEYLSIVENYYGGKTTNLDFVNETEKSRQIINSYIEGQTANRIKDLIPSGALDASTRLVLTNAIYFKGTWQWEFDKSKTREQDFIITPTNTIKTQMMYLNNEDAKFNYADVGDLQILDLPYKGEDLSMLVLLPKDDLSSIESKLTVENLEKWKSQMSEEKLDTVSLPKFEFDSKYFMKNTLSAMGMPTAFAEDADFSGMNGKKDLYIDNVIHQSFIKVDEEGTEAAAATAVVMLEKAMIETNNTSFALDI